MKAHAILRFYRPLLLALATCVLLLLVVTAVALAGLGDTTRVSTSSTGGEGNNDSLYPAISADGRYVAFESYASNLVAVDSNGAKDVVVKDTQTGETRLVSTDSAGVQGNADSYHAAISADGRYVAFLSNASNLVPDDTNACTDAFVKDTLTGVTTRVSTASDGAQMPDGASYTIMISADGRFVTFEAYNAGAGLDWWRKDTLTGALTKLNINTAGSPILNLGLFSLSAHSMSADANSFVFSTYTYMGFGYYFRYTDVYLRDIASGATTLVSIDGSGGSGGQSNGDSGNASISANGRYVVFKSTATNLVGHAAQLYLKDTVTGILRSDVCTSSAGVPANNACLNGIPSDDGRYVYFESDADNLVPGDTNLARDIFVKDMLTGEMKRISTGSAGEQASMSPWSINPLYINSSSPSVSGDGRYVAFTSGALHLVPVKNNWVASRGWYANDIYVKDIAGCQKAALALSRTRVYWANYEDYMIGWLSVDYQVANNSGFGAFSARIETASATGGVTVATSLPYDLGDIPGGSSAAFTLRYVVPVGVSGFRASLTASASDACGATHTFP